MKPKQTSVRVKRGKRSPSKARGPVTDPGHWQHLCDVLREERDRLQMEVAQLRAERDQYKNAVYALLWETAKDIEIDKKAILAQMGQGQPLEEFIAELEAQGES